MMFHSFEISNFVKIMMKKDYSDNKAGNRTDRIHNDIDQDELLERGLVCEKNSEDLVSVICDGDLCDAEMLRIVCPDCGESYKHLVSYGHWLLRQELKEHPPMCPKCGSRNYKL